MAKSGALDASILGAAQKQMRRSVTQFWSTATLPLRPVLEGQDHVKLRMPRQMRNINLARGAIAIEFFEVLVVRCDDHDVRSDMISVIGAMGGSMQVRDPCSGKHVYDTDLVDVDRSVS